MNHALEAPAYYELHIAGRLDPEWADWFDGLTVSPGPDGTTILAGLVTDQAALHGYLARVRDLGLPLLALTRHLNATGDA
jgi:hypothetical protein